MSDSPDLGPEECEMERFGAFVLKNVAYKTTAGKSLWASILTPRSLRPGKHPVIVRWHGGGLVNGHRLYAQWIAPYILEHAEQTQAIMVIPDYRLLPGISSALDILDDMRDLFAWLFTADNLESHLYEGIGADLNDVLVSGESAGGWLALQSAFVQGPGRIKAVIAQYPMIDMRDGHWAAKGENKYLQGASVVDPVSLGKYFAQGEKGVTSRIPPRGSDLYLGLVQHGMYSKMFGDHESLYPLELLDQKSPLPPIWLIHGSGDTIVPVSGSLKFAERVLQTRNTPLHLTIRDGEEHLFDVNTDAQHEWVQSGQGFVGKYWPLKQLVDGD